MRNTHRGSARRSGRGLIALGLGVIAVVATPASAGAPSTGCNVADIAPPFGVLDLQDVGAFVNGFVSLDLIADMNNDGILDLQDVSLFISNFLGGCPTLNCIPDVRTVVDGADLDPPHIQQNYDAINRTLHLVGDLTLAEVYAQTPAQLFPILDARLETLNDCVPGNTVDPELIRIELVQMSLVGPQMPLGDIFTFGPGSEPFWGALDNLRALGIGVPDAPAGPPEIAARQAALPLAVEFGAAVTCAMLFFDAAADQPPEVIAGLQPAMEAQLLAAAVCDNDKCCDEGGGAGGITDACLTDTQWCNLTGLGGALCSIASDPCP